MIPKLGPSAAMALATILISQTSIATHYRENIQSGTDIMMKDLRWPEWDQGTYYCVWYSRFVPKGAARHSFYGGVAVHGAKRRPGATSSPYPSAGSSMAGATAERDPLEA